MFFTMHHKSNQQQLLDKQMASHFLGNVKLLQVLFINLQRQVLGKKKVNLQFYFLNDTLLT